MWLQLLTQLFVQRSHDPWQVQGEEYNEYMYVKCVRNGKLKFFPRKKARFHRQLLHYPICLI